MTTEKLEEMGLVKKDGLFEGFLTNGDMPAPAEIAIFAVPKWMPTTLKYEWAMKSDVLGCQFEGAVESKITDKFSLSRGLCKDQTREFMGDIGGSEVTTLANFHFAYCGLATSAPYNFSVISTAFPDKPFIGREASRSDYYARGWSVELEDTFIDCATMATKAGNDDLKLQVMADCRDRCVHWSAGSQSKGSPELPGSYSFLFFPLRGDVENKDKVLVDVVKTSYGAIEPSIILLLSANYDCLSLENWVSDACTAADLGKEGKNGKKIIAYNKLMAYEPVMYYYLAQASSMMHDLITAKWVTITGADPHQTEVLDTLAWCVSEGDETYCPSVYCGDVTIDFRASGGGDQSKTVDKVE